MRATESQPEVLVRNDLLALVDESWIVTNAMAKSSILILSSRRRCPQFGCSLFDYQVAESQSVEIVA